MAADKILVTGHSHTIALGCLHVATNGNAVLETTHSDARFWFLGGAVPGTPEYHQELDRIAQECPIVLLWGGNLHFTKFFLTIGKDFDFVASGLPHMPLLPDAEIVPESAVTSALNDDGGLCNLIVRLRQEPAARVFVCGTPPPKGDIALSEAVMRSEPHWATLAAQAGIELTDLKPRNPATMLKLWKILQSKFEHWANSNGAIYIPVPDIARDDAGFLRPEYWARDVTHGNEAYGATMRDHIHQIVHG